MASDTVTSIVGFTELACDGKLYNAAAVLQRGRIAGIYRKIHPAIRRSVYSAGSKTPVFRAGELAFGIVICNDSNYPALVRRLAARRITALFIPTNNSLPDGRASVELNAAARATDIALATDNRIWVIRADLVGRSWLTQRQESPPRPLAISLDRVDFRFMRHGVPTTDSVRRSRSTSMGTILFHMAFHLSEVDSLLRMGAALGRGYGAHGLSKGLSLLAPASTLVANRHSLKVRFVWIFGSRRDRLQPAA